MKWGLLLTKIFGEKDGDPVAVYPVWNNEYLKNIRIDEKYLKRDHCAVPRQT